MTRFLILLAIFAALIWIVVSGGTMFSGLALLILIVMAIAMWPSPKKPTFQPKEGRVFKRRARAWTFTVVDELGIEYTSTRNFPTQQGAHTAMRRYCSEVQPLHGNF